MTRWSNGQPFGCAGRTLVLALLGFWAVLAGCSSSEGQSTGNDGGSSSSSGGGSSGSSSGNSGSSSGGGSNSSSGGSSSGGSSGSSDGGSGGSPVPFHALNTYYISPTGNDNNSGTSPAMAWATPKHSVSCGDVIIAAPGAYKNGQFNSNNWGTVASCPSTSGGIDGKGGVYFAVLLCGGPDLTSCTVDGGGQETFRVDSSNWAIEGFAGTQSATASEGGFAVGCYTATSETSATLHHVAFINDVASGCDAAGFGTFSWTGPGGGVDQYALVGAIAYDAAPSQGGMICGSGISIIPVNGSDTSSGTHVFVAGAFSYKNVNAPIGAGCNTDGEGLIFDSWGVQPYKYQAVAEQNVFWANGGPGFEAFPQGNFTSDDQATIVLFNNTSYGNFQDPKHVGSGDLMLNQVYPTTGSYAFTNNIFEATVTSSAGGTVYGAAIDCSNGCPANVIATNGNYIWNSHPPTTTVSGGRNTQAWYNGMDQGASFPWGANTFDDPGFANPGALPAGAPNCSGFANTTACMIGAGVPANIKPSGGAAGKGYQPPGACTADAYYPTWLKGVVYLKASGSNLTENAGLITKPCNL
jgi:hypothetical protein